MRKLAESTLVMLDDVTQAPERRASFDAESTAYSAEQLKLRCVRHGPGHLQKFTGKPDRGNKPDQADSDPRPAAVTFVTTEHFTLQGARSSTISESTGRASVFLQAVSGGLIALGLVATAAKTGAAFYMFGLILLPTLAFVGLATFHRVLQSGIEDLGYARRIAQLRCYYLDHAPDPKTVKNRVHLDLTSSATDRDQEIDRLLALGARRAGIGQTGAESWTVLADPEGNEFCVVRPKETLTR